MDYSTMNDEDILRDLAEKADQLRIEHQVKETDLEKSSGISRKTFYNFKQGNTGFSLKNFIRLLRALGETQRLQWMFPETESYSPLSTKTQQTAKRVRDRQKSEGSFRWGDEE
jgi:predicted transcriptional regulator